MYTYIYTLTVIRIIVRCQRQVPAISGCAKKKVADKCGILSAIKPGKLRANDDGNPVASL